MRSHQSETSLQDLDQILEDLGGSLKILTRIFEDLNEDPHEGSQEDPRKSWKILERFSPGVSMLMKLWNKIFNVIRHIWLMF